MADLIGTHPGDGTAEPMIRLDAVGKRYPDGTVAVTELSLDVARGELLALVGPSGCGKSTTLRMINRLIEPTSGRIVIDGQDAASADPVQLRRGIGYVIQRIGLFPHRTVLQNVTTVPELSGWDAARSRTRATDLLELVGLDPGVYADRYPHELSGGQQQRVGVARALAADPPVLLMDEPFGAVDPVARDQLQERFATIQAELHKSVVLVTHDIDEAVRLGDRIAVLGAQGTLEQLADPATLLAHPANERVAEFVGTDGGLRRLAVTALGTAHLEQLPTVTVSSRDEDGADGAVRAARLRAGGQPLLVLDAAGEPLGWYPPDGDPALHALDPAVRVGISLREAFAALTASRAGWVPVRDGDGRYVGALTPATVHATLRAGGTPRRGGD